MLSREKRAPAASDPAIPIRKSPPIVCTMSLQVFRLHAEKGEKREPDKLM